MMNTYRIQENILSTEERSLFHALTLVIAHRALLLSKIQLSSLISPQIRHSRAAAFSQLDRYTVDFVLCDADTTQPLLVILQDHPAIQSSIRCMVNEHVTNLCRSVALPVVRLPYKGAYRMDELVSMLEPFLDHRSSAYNCHDQRDVLPESRVSMVPQTATMICTN